MNKSNKMGSRHVGTDEPAFKEAIKKNNAGLGVRKSNPQRLPRASGLRDHWSSPDGRDRLARKKWSIHQFVLLRQAWNEAAGVPDPSSGKSDIRIPNITNAELDLWKKYGVDINQIVNHFACSNAERQFREYGFVWMTGDIMNKTEDGFEKSARKFRFKVFPDATFERVEDR